MAAHRRLVLLILLYVALDLSVASMPGAFVFEVGDSVESVQTGRARQIAEVGRALARPRDPKSVIVEEVAAKPAPGSRPVPPTPLRRFADPPPATPEPPALSEDSH